MPIDEIVRRSYLTRISADDALVSLAERRYVAENEGKFSLTESGRDLFSKLKAQIDRFEAEQLHGALRDRGIPCELLVYADEGHGLQKLHNQLAAYPRAVAFLDGVLRR